MKTILLNIILLIFTSLVAKAQDCQIPCPYYNDFVKKAQADTVKNTQAKLNYYRAAVVAARDCDCPKLEQLAQNKMDTLFILIEEEKRKAELQAKTISQQQAEIEKTLAETEAANETNIKIIDAMDFYDGKFGLASKNGKYGFIDKEGNTTIDFDYDKGRPFSSGDGFARMEIVDRFSNKGIEYLIDTIGNRYQLFDITEEYIVLLKKRLAKHKRRSKLEGRESLKSVNELLAYELNKTEEKIALYFYKVKNKNILSILKYLAEDNEIRNRIEVVILSDKNLYKFPNSIIEFKKLKYLDISYTGMKSIPKKIDELIELKRLSFPSYLKKLPSSVYNLENLEVLNLYDTELSITKIPTTIDRLVNLKELYVPEKLEALPENLGNLSNLKTLDLSTIEVQRIPKSIGNLKKLKKLRLPSKLKKIPLSIYYLENLENLDLYGTDEKKIPEAIGNLKKIKKLEIQTPFEKIPSSICKLENIEYLLLESEEEIISFPDSIENWKKLKELYLFFPLKVLPKSICKLESLEILYLPPLLESLPNDFGNLINLDELSIPSSVKSLPNNFGNLTNLTFLEIEDNSNLKSIPDISKMKKLKNFYFTLYKDENYAVNLEKLKELQEKLPDCEFDVSDENGNTINLKRD